jgi:hypothetical protein
MRFAQLIEWIPAYTTPQSWRFADSFAGMTEGLGLGSRFAGMTEIVERNTKLKL